MLGACAALALGAGAARGQTTAIVFDASLDYVNWSAAIDANPGDTVYVRMRVRLDGATSLGLAGMTCTPTLSQWSVAAGDTLEPFTPESNHGVPFEPFNTGRLHPFASSGLPLGFIPSSVNGATLVIGRNGSYVFGVATSQLTQALGGGDFNTSLFPNVFVYSVRLSDAGERRMIADAPMQWVGNQRAAWYMQANGLNSMNSTVDGVETATIHVAPAPGVLELGAGLGMLATLRRRGAP